MSDLPLHQQNPLTRFSDRATDYAKYRPSYPTQVIDQILAGLADRDRLIAADVGAGTGISARLLGDRGVQVWAIEPNAAMGQAAARHAQVQWITAAAEATGLPDDSVDLVTVFQAFHWFDQPAALAEFRRILKPTGRLALVWNSRDRSDGFTRGYSDLVQQISQQHPAESRHHTSDTFFNSPHFQHQRQFAVPSQQALTLEQLIGRARSISYIPKTDAVQHELIAGLQQLYDQWADQGLVYMVYQTLLYMAEPQR
jgi:ubiquinone/menaquinone biosynthesis C-methylase UbiE